jgi:hypothetical protein
MKFPKHTINIVDKNHICINIRVDHYLIPYGCSDEHPLHNKIDRA